MKPIKLSDELIEKLRKSPRGVEICNESGEVVGFFSPKLNSADYEGLEPDISDEELLRRMKSNEPRYSTAEVLRHLESL